ncbi:hypothetical protein [Pseudoalteromonas luteoviolacea]|uniref:Uncharacterized protein n=1 Tax=Pseudoalteromonas luteoviolacea H33 TaxID=1365251 RepID=A0A167E4J2_9GAMM|nr:hypothetical protein [Pseudoalteromonas luteoviolacea]KZN50032.1 hypothetical protein N476_16935 [Pseudoalteromonas luteoviolacea H33]KZN76394.1 hypothetical protein N477_16950 [Pseudoalteromonas luteoviolacea H33-S]MBQ4877787.1 hypothetical protein [Pseudoalteromonas luteoviolacea]MBQ4906767.1 hypothetical protein [Pseudoalteromonas luteoviolacea]
MKLNLNKKKLKSLSSDSNAFPADLTPRVGGGRGKAVDSEYTCYIDYTDGDACNTVTIPIFTEYKVCFVTEQ